MTILEFCWLFLGSTNVFNRLVRLDSEWSAYFYRLVVRREEEREFCIWDLHGFAWRYYVLGLIVYCFHGDVCRYLWFSCHLERDFRVLGSQYNFYGF